MSIYRQTGQPFRRRCIAVAGAWLAMAWASPAAIAGTLASEALAVIEAYNTHDPVGLPVPSDEEIGQLMDGQVVMIRRQVPMTDSTGVSEERIRIVGYRYFERPRLLIWLSALDIGQQHAERLTEHLIWSDDGGNSLWYQHLNMPWPVKNRHWVIRNTKSTDLTAATRGVAWEHAWRLETGGKATAMRVLDNGEVADLDRRDGEKAIYLPINRGGWTMFDLDGDRVLVAAHVSTVLGGMIPDGVVARFAARHLDMILSGLESRSQTIHERYDTSYPIFTGDARPITRAMAIEAHDRATATVTQR